jgi:hypothetical protein
LLPAEVAVLVGGRALPAYRATLESLGAVQIEELAQVGTALDQLRAASRKVNS